MSKSKTPSYVMLMLRTQMAAYFVLWEFTSVASV